MIHPYLVANGKRTAFRLSSDEIYVQIDEKYNQAKAIGQGYRAHYILRDELEISDKRAQKYLESKLVFRNINRKKSDINIRFIKQSQILWKFHHAKDVGEDYLKIDFVFFATVD